MATSDTAVFVWLLVQSPTGFVSAQWALSGYPSLARCEEELAQERESAPRVGEDILATNVSGKVIARKCVKRDESPKWDTAIMQGEAAPVERLGSAESPLAGEAGRGMWYLGLAVGVSNHEQLVHEAGSAIYDQMIDRFRLTPAQANSVSELRDSYVLTATLGAEFGTYFGAEVSYADLGSPQYDYLGNTHPPGLNGWKTLYDQRSWFRADGIALSLVGHWPIGSRWRLHGRLGAFHSRTRATAKLCHPTEVIYEVNPDGSYHSRLEDYCSPSSEQPGEFAAGELGNVRFSGHSTAPMFGLGMERLGPRSRWRVEYSAYREANPRTSDSENAKSLDSVPQSSIVQFISLTWSVTGRIGGSP